MVKVNRMPNFIRACFCIEHFSDFADLLELQKILTNYNCQIIEKPTVYLETWNIQNLTWQILGKPWVARLFQLPSVSENCSMVSFDVDSLMFLPGHQITYLPGGEQWFLAYKMLLTDLIKHLRPYIGIIDYEADLLCKDRALNNFSAWGNYLSNKFLTSWNQAERLQIPVLVDEYTDIENIGLIIFNHPLGYENPTEKKIKFWEMIKTHI
jgi:hypothetical protein